MSSVNNVVLVGRLGADPEYRAFNDGGVANFSMATDRAPYSDGTDWHRVSAFGKSGEFVGDYMKKGNLLAVQGRIQYRKTDDGKFYTDIIANRVQSLGSKAENEASLSEASSDGLPF